MADGTCWHCADLIVEKDIDEIFWHYRCRRFPNKGELDPGGFTRYMGCYRKRNETNKVKQHEGIYKEEYQGLECLKPGNIVDMIERLY